MKCSVARLYEIIWFLKIGTIMMILDSPPIWKIQDLVYDDILLDGIFQFRIKIPGISIFY